MVVAPRDPAVPPGEHVPTADGRVILHDVGWAQLETILTIRGEDASGPRIAYLLGELELMSPSRDHEKLGSLIGRLLEAYAVDRGIELCPYGSWFMKSPPKARGVEPDECYVFGTDQADKEVPDLAIEVIWTSGGIDMLEIYRGLGVPEVWFWKAHRIEVYVLEGDDYARRDRSLALPDLDLDLLVEHLEHDTLTQAVRAFRAALT